jgi:oligopeptide transport system substrate-binding protein
MRKGQFALAALTAILISGNGFAADMNKVLHVAFNAPETGFDPAKISDQYSSSIVENIFDPLITYDYLARPVKLIPNTTEAMPTISKDGKVYTFHLKHGIYFADDPAFGGKKRELVAEDYAYSIKRLLDPTINSPYSFLVNGRFVGGDELVAKAGKNTLDYNAPLEGIKTLDKYTLQLTLKETNFNMTYILSMPVFGAVAREVIEANAANTMAHPVGTGPYLLKEWKPGTKMVLEANPNYRKDVFNFAPSKDAIDAGIIKAMKGKTLPCIGRVEVSIIEEEQPTWLAFLEKQLDISGIPQPALQEALVIDPKDPTKATLNPKYAKMGIQHQRYKLQEVTYTYFNMDDSVVGGDSKEKLALRRAIAMAFPRSETIAAIRRGQAVPVNYMIPEGVGGHNPNFKGAAEYDPAKANALLDKFGYKKGADGWRVQPNGKPLSIEYATGSAAIDKQWNEYWQKAFDSLKIHVTWKVGKWNELDKEARQSKLQMWGLAWGADYPDGDNFMMLLYGKNAGDVNYANFKNAEYDKLFESSLKLPDGPERNKLYDQMNKIVVAQQPWIFGDTRVRNTLAQPYVKGFKIHPIVNTTWRYIDLQK